MERLATVLLQYLDCIRTLLSFFYIPFIAVFVSFLFVYLL